MVKGYYERVEQDPACFPLRYLAHNFECKDVYSWRKTLKTESEVLHKCFDRILPLRTYSTENQVLLAVCSWGVTNSFGHHIPAP